MGGNGFMLIYYDNNNSLVAVGELPASFLPISMFHFGLNVQSNVTTAKLTAATC